MKTKTRLPYLLFFLLTFTVSPVFSQEAVLKPDLEAGAKTMDEVTLSQGQEHVIQKIATEYQDFLGPDADNAVTVWHEMYENEYGIGAFIGIVAVTPYTTGRLGSQRG